MVDFYQPSEGQKTYDAVVGSSGIATHATLKEALDDVTIGPGSRILVQDSEVINTTPQVNDDNLHIEFVQGVTFSKGTATIGLEINSNGCKIINGRFINFNGGSDEAVKINAAKSFNSIISSRFLNNTTDLNNAGIKSVITGVINE